MRKLMTAMVMLFLGMFFAVTENAYAHGFVQSRWAEEGDSRIVCSTDGNDAYAYGVGVVEEAENKKEQRDIVTFLAGPDIMRAFVMFSIIKNNPETLRDYYKGNRELTLHIKVLPRYPSCGIETQRIKFVQQKTEP